MANNALDFFRTSDIWLVGYLLAVGEREQYMKEEQPEKLFRIVDRDCVYENSRSRSIDACNWVPHPNKQDGLGYNMLVAKHDNGMARYGIWVTLVCH